MALKPWRKVVDPRADLREGRPLDASEFAVHLDYVRNGTAPDVYTKPEEFFERTYLTKNLSDLAAEVVRRLSGETTETNAVFNMATQFGGGKTHALTLLYHLATKGPGSEDWKGVKSIIQKAGTRTVPKAAVAVFVGTEFDSIIGRGGDDGTPKRMTPWGEIAFQLGGVKAFEVVAGHEESGDTPAGDAIRKFLPDDKPVLILIDELMNYVSRNRKSGMANKLYNFLHNLTETARGRDNVVVAISTPASELEMTVEDHADFARFKKDIDRLGKAVIMSAETETSEIIRRRLFEWQGLPSEANPTVNEFSAWVVRHKDQLGDFDVDNAYELFAASYPFHPSVLSVFERKWQSRAGFQRTRGVLRLLALWVSNAFDASYRGALNDPLIGLGTAPLDNPIFRSALIEQLGADQALEAALTTDINGKKDSHAIRLDKEAIDAIKKSRLHKKVATTIFFESNGGQTQDTATLPEIRFAAAEPDLDIGNIETVLESLARSCYYLSVEGNSYKYSLQPNLNKLLADRKSTVNTKVNERVLEEVRKVFTSASGVDMVFYPQKSSDIPDRPVLTCVVLPPEKSMQDKEEIRRFVESMSKEHGSSGRTFKNALIWCIPDSAAVINEEARKVLAWESIDDEADELRIDEKQKRQLSESLKRAQRDLNEAVWRTYKFLMLLGKNNEMRIEDLGLIHSSQTTSKSPIRLFLDRLEEKAEVVKMVHARKLVSSYWPPAFEEWPTKAVRDAFFASPLLPRLLSAEAVKESISSGVSAGLLAYVGKAGDDKYDPFIFEKSILPTDIEIADDVYIIKKEVALAYVAKMTEPQPPQPPPQPPVDPPEPPEPPDDPPLPPPETDSVERFKWTGDISPQKWTNFYRKVLTPYVTGGGLTLKLTVEVAPEGGVSKQRLEETKTALRELGMDDEVE
jgi:Protein of unknown function (DUF499)